MTRFHLAQANMGLFRAPLESPILEGFRTQLDPINALADRSPGFVWRLQTEDGNATAIRPYAGDDLMAINLSVWESLEGPILGALVDSGGEIPHRGGGAGTAAISKGTAADPARVQLQDPVPGS